MSDNTMDLLKLSASLADFGIDKRNSTKFSQARKEEKKQTLFSLMNQESNTLKKGKPTILSSIRSLIFFY
jgi:hypothetical protein